MNLTLIAATSQNRVIGKDGDLVWHLPDDLKRFKKLTENHHIIMGRKTYESMGKPLPKRTNIVVTRNEDFEAEGCIVAHNLKDAILKAENDAQPFIIGGGKIYKQSLEFADTIELTLVHGEFEGDAFFPEISDENWELVEKEHHPKDEKHDYAFDYLTYRKIK